LGDATYFILNIRLAPIRRSILILGTLPFYTIRKSCTPKIKISSLSRYDVLK
jgi:hypothetical protein